MHTATFHAPPSTFDSIRWTHQPHAATQRHTPAVIAGVDSRKPELLAPRVG